MFHYSAFLILFATSLSYSAPSFDCKKASAPIEKAICADQELSALDSKIADAYKAALAKAKTPAEKEKLKVEQKTFNQKRTVQCPDLKVDCLRSFFQARVSLILYPDPASTATPAPATQGKVSWEGCFRGPDQILCVSRCTDKGCRFSFEGVQAAPCSDTGNFLFAGKDRMSAIMKKMNDQKKACQYSFELSKNGKAIGVDDNCGNCSVGVEFDFSGDYERND